MTNLGIVILLFAPFFSAREIYDQDCKDLSSFDSPPDGCSTCNPATGFLTVRKEECPAAFAEELYSVISSSFCNLSPSHPFYGKYPGEVTKFKRLDGTLFDCDNMPYTPNCPILQKCAGKQPGVPCDGSPGAESCCSSVSPCPAGGGDCDYDTDCTGSLVCGTDNCPNAAAKPDSDCCMVPPIVCPAGQFRCNDICVDDILTDFYIFIDRFCYPKKDPIRGECTTNWKRCGDTCIESTAKCNEALGCPVRIRKDLKNLTPIEVADLNQAMETIKANGKFTDQVASFHGDPHQCCPHNPSYPYRNELFLFWHTVHIEQMEDALAEHLCSPTLGLPYWDWTEQWDDSTPLIRNIASPVQNNPWSSALLPNGTESTRRTSLSLLKSSGAEWKRQLDISLCKSNFMMFSQDLEVGPHNLVHGYIGGDMGAIPYASYDPIFYLHHNTVEKYFREYQMCQDTHFASSWTTDTWAEDELLNLSLRCFEDPAINNNPNTGAQTVSSIIMNRKNLCYEYENLQCTRTSCPRRRTLTRSLVFNMKPVPSSGQFSFEICIPRDACTDGCCYLATRSLHFFGTGSGMPRMQRNTNNPYILDITDLLEGYEGYNRNDTWLATVPVQTRLPSFKDYSGNNLSLALIDPIPHNVVTRKEKETILIFWDQVHESTIFAKGNANIEFFNSDGRSPVAWEFDNGNGRKKDFKNCDLSHLKEVKTPLTVTKKGFHYYYNNLTAPSCDEKSKVAVFITD